MSAPRSFWVETLGCKVNAADGDRIARLLRRRGLAQAPTADAADVRVVNTCSVTSSAAAQSRAATRKATSLPVLKHDSGLATHPAAGKPVLVTGCWATSNPAEARALPGVSGVITHHDDLEAELDRHLSTLGVPRTISLPQAGVPVRQEARQRAFLKVQDGCDAHCTYCIIPQLRPKLWSIGEDDAVTEVRQLVDAGHREVVLTGIFLGAYGQTTALRRRQPHPGGHHLVGLIRAICTRVPELPRLRLSSLEPGDLTDDLLAELAAHPQVVPHFHLPIQSGSDAILRRMNRQYTRDDFCRLVDRLRDTFDRPALTTDVVAGFPGEDDGDFADTLSLTDHAGFIHVHAFPYSPRPGTAAARWTDEAIPQRLATDRVKALTDRAAEHSLAFRRSFVGQEATVIIERGTSAAGHRHGRCERYFDIELPGVTPDAGDLVKVVITEVSGTRTAGEVSATPPRLQVQSRA